MTGFFATTEEIREQGIPALKGVEIKDLNALVPLLFQNQIEPYLSEGVVDRLTQATPEPALNPAEIRLKAAMKRATAFFVVHKYMQTGEVQISGSGVQRLETDTFKTAFKQQIQSANVDIEGDAWLSLEKMIKIAASNAPDIQGYVTSKAAKNNVCRFINFCDDTEGAMHKIGRRSLESIFPYIRTVERLIVVPMLGKKLYDSLKAEQYKSDLSEIKAELIELIRRGIFEYGLKLATEANAVTLMGDRVVTIEWKNDDAKAQISAPRRDLLAMSQANREEMAEIYFSETRKFLVANTTALEWTAPVEETVVKSTVTEVGVKKF